MIYICRYASPLGQITMAGEGDALTGLWFDGQKYFASTLPADCRESVIPVFEEAKKWLDIYFCGEEPGFTPKLMLRGSEFRRMVWDILLSIPYGETTTYGKIAERIAEKTGVKTMSAQAVGGAVGHNPISVIVPCHRVVGSDGSLTGYAGGTEKKRFLLELEKRTFEIRESRHE